MDDISYLRNQLLRDATPEYLEALDAPGADYLVKQHKEFLAYCLDVIENSPKEIKQWSYDNLEIRDKRKK